MPKDKKAKAAEKKARTAQKQDKKSAKKEKKTSGRSKKEVDGDEEDVDLDAVLADFEARQKEFLRVSEVVCEPPGARSSSTLIASPGSENELFLFGGEYYNGLLAKFYNDLFCYNTRKDEWRCITSPNSPLPRSGHAWCRGGNTGGIYLFGGEFSSPKQGTFYHYNDFWRLDPATREWSKIETKSKGPPARSGHRMTYFKQYIILFGGFQDTSSQTKYLQDLWLYDTQNFAWHNPVLPPASQKPDARSSFTLLPHEGGAVLSGGYSRVKSTVHTRALKGSSGAAQMAVMKPIVHQDSWFLRITPPAADAPSQSAPTVRWERRKRPANAPNPARAGATMAYHRGRGIQFGGVHDVENSEEGIESEFFNTLFVWNIERNRYFSLALRKPRANQQKRAAPGNAERGKRGRGKADEEELLKNLADIEKRGGFQDGQDPDEKIDEPSEDEEDEALPEKTVMWEMPHARFNAQLAVQGDTLYIYGGTFEKGDQEFTFDEIWAIDMGKLDGVKEIFKRDLQDWQGSEDEEEDEEEDYDREGSDEEEGNSDSDEESNRDRASVGESSRDVSSPITPMAELSIADPMEGEGTEESQPDKAEDSNLPYPRPFETLRAFYARSASTWLELLVEEGKRGSSNVSPSMSEKELRKIGFARSEGRWWDCREDVLKEEDALEEAGVGEVVSVDKDRAGDATTTGARRR